MTDVLLTIALAAGAICFLLFCLSRKKKQPDYHRESESDE